MKTFCDLMQTVCKHVLHTLCLWDKGKEFALSQALANAGVRRVHANHGTMSVTFCGVSVEHAGRDDESRAMDLQQDRLSPCLPNCNNRLTFTPVFLSR